jgi:hypothetical protein
VLLSLDLEMPGLQAAIPVTILYGSGTSPSTVKVLKPGESADILAKKSWEFYGVSQENLWREGFEREFEVTARLSWLSALEGQVYTDSRSTNSVRIRLRKNDLQ